MNRCHVIVASLLLALPAAAAISQDASPDPVVWSASVESVPAPSGERRYRLLLNGRIAAGYIVYGSDFKAQLGPNPTRLRFDAGQQITPLDALLSSGTRRGRAEDLKVDYTYFEGEAHLSQVLTVAPSATRIAGSVVGQTCHEADGTCALFRGRFDVALAPAPAH